MFNSRYLKHRFQYRTSRLICSSLCKKWKNAGAIAGPYGWWMSEPCKTPGGRQLEVCNSWSLLATRSCTCWFAFRFLLFVCLVLTFGLHLPLEAHSRGMCCWFSWDDVPDISLRPVHLLWHGLDVLQGYPLLWVIMRTCLGLKSLRLNMKSYWEMFGQPCKMPRSWFASWSRRWCSLWKSQWLQFATMSWRSWSNAIKCHWTKEMSATSFQRPSPSLQASLPQLTKKKFQRRSFGIFLKDG